MMEENTNASMEIKTVDENGEEMFHNDYIDNTDICESADDQQDTPVTQVCLRRTKDGLIRDDENGKEISSIFDIIEVGDNINHQSVVAIENHQATLDYFGQQSVISDEREIFSILIKEEMDYWKESLKERDLTKMFEYNEEDMVHLFRALEFICMNVNMEQTDMITTSYTSDDVILDQRILTMIFGTLRKSIVDSQEDIEGKKVVNIIYNYNLTDIEETKKDIESKKGKYLYTIALVNKNNEEVADGDIVILC